MDWLHFDSDTGLAGLFLTSYLSATLLPGGSEAVLLAVVGVHPADAMPALGLATLGNTLGGMTTYALSRLLPARAMERLSPQRLEWVRRWGSLSLLLAWTPLVGDLLCAAAGWLRLPSVPCALWMALGKGARYTALLWMVGLLGA
jgi:membrane protein YqaA with SNARE-associated domain